MEVKEKNRFVFYLLYIFWNKKGYEINIIIKVQLSMFIKTSTFVKILIILLISFTMADIVFLEEARKQYLDGEGNVDWNKVEARYA